MMGTWASRFEPLFDPLLSAGLGQGGDERRGLNKGGSVPSHNFPWSRGLEVPQK